MRNSKPLRDRLGKRILTQLQKRKITNAEAAEQLGVSESYLSRTVAAIQTKEPGTTVAQRKANSKLAKARREFRVHLAKDVLKRRISVEDAAERANCSTRTIFRFMELYRQ